MKKFFLLLIIALLSANYADVYSQSHPANEPEMRERDSTCFRYKFFPGDSLYYYVVGYDSIIIDYDDALMRTRYERWLLTCDSVSKDDHYFLSFKMVDYLAKEKKGKMEPVTRKTSPWIGRTAHLWIDSLGRRYSSFQEDETVGAMSPGGAFTPHLLIKLDESCKAVNESWLVNGVESLTENGFPYPNVDRTMLIRAKAPADTLDYTCNRLNFISTGSGEVTVVSDLAKVHVSAILNGFGDLYMSNKEWIPVHYHGKLEQKLTIVMPEEYQKPGWQYVQVDYSLSRFIPSPERLKYHEEKEKAAAQPVQKKK